jgi:hypothetical protein
LAAAIIPNGPVVPAAADRDDEPAGNAEAGGPPTADRGHGRGK